jgi:hypothetical protein
MDDKPPIVKCSLVFDQFRIKHVESSSKSLMLTTPRRPYRVTPSAEPSDTPEELEQVDQTTLDIEKKLLYVDTLHLRMDAEGVLSEEPDPTASTEPTLVAESSWKDGTRISTAFIPVCIRSDNGRAECFETIVFRDQKSTVVARYCGLRAALRGHDAVGAFGATRSGLPDRR